MNIQEPSSQHAFQQRDVIKQNQTTNTQQLSKPSIRSDPKVLKQYTIVEGCGEALCLHFGTLADHLEPQGQPGRLGAALRKRGDLESTLYRFGDDVGMPF